MSKSAAPVSSVMLRTRTARFLLAAYLAFIVYVQVASDLARSGMASLPLGIADLLLSIEASISMLVIALILIALLFRRRRKQEASK
jgi:membrane protein DedA with SNARE-associated domain